MPCYSNICHTRYEVPSQSFIKTINLFSTSRELAGLAAAATNVEVGDARVVIADLVVIVLPRVEVEVLVLGALCNGGADEHVVESLGVHVEEIGVALGDGHVDNIIKVDEARDLLEGSEGLNLDKLVEVAGSDDGRRGVLLQDIGDEVLE